jgi:hypothetical protein
MNDDRAALPLTFLIDAADSVAYGNSDLWPMSGPNRPSNGEKFIIAMSYGFKMKARVELKKSDASFMVRSEYFKDDDKALLYAIAVATKGDLDVALDGKEVAHIAEAYAHGGITLLAQKLRDAPEGTLWDDLETEVLDLTSAMAELGRPSPTREPRHS